MAEMKKFAAFAIMAVVCTGGFAKEGALYYWYKGQKQPLTVRPGKTFLLLDRHKDMQSLSSGLRVDKAKIEHLVEGRLGATHATTPQSPQKYYWAVVNSGIEAMDISMPGLVYTAPFFQSALRQEVGLTHLFYVKLHPQQEKAQLASLARRQKVEVLYNDELLPQWYTLACDRNSAGNALEMANLFYESGLFAAAEPDWVPTAPFQTVNDPFYGSQWNLENTGQSGGTSGEDIQMADAWRISKSHSGVTIAINDLGVELNHPDLPNIHAFSFDSPTNSSPSQIRGDHGTIVAGVAGANTNNSIGVAGVAPQSQIMSLANLIVSDYGRSIGEAWYNGASVINNSWVVPGSGYIDDAIDSAVNLGRGGLGAVLVGAAGNFNDSPISYPASNSNVLAVGATNRWGGRIHQYGTGLDVMAPGTHIYTTDRQDTAGVNKSPGTAGDYHIDGGTSLSAPQVSGIAALVLSINGTLTQQQVRNAIEGSAEKVGGYTYTLGAGERSGLTWNNEMGYGRANAYRALIYTIENYGAHLGVEMNQVGLPLYDDIALPNDITLESGSNLTIEAKNNVTVTAGGSVGIGFASGGQLALRSGGTLTLAAASGTVTIGGSGGGSLAKGGAARVAARQPEASRPSGTRSVEPGITRISRSTDGMEVRLRLLEEAPVLIEAYDPAGRKVSLPQPAQWMPVGVHALRLPLQRNNQGILYLRVKAGDKVYQGIVPPL